jgi:hypothetical protein
MVFQNGKDDTESTVSSDETIMSIPSDSPIQFEQKWRQLQEKLKHPGWKRVGEHLSLLKVSLADIRS